MFKFPGDFYWGAATAAYQVEGANSNSDWWEWEIRAGLKDRSGQACRHYDLYNQDFDLAKQLHHNAHRLSIEWSRVEPEEGKFSETGLAHYRDVILALKERGIEPIVTLHHFTNPIWFARRGGWLDRSSPKYFLRYVGKVIRSLGDLVRFWVTINEPMVYVYHSFYLGDWPPQEKSLFKARAAALSLVRAHIRAYHLIHDVYRRENLPAPYVSVAHNVQAFVACNAAPRSMAAAYIRDRWFNFGFLKRLIRSKSLDFIGINYYTRSLVEPANWGLRSMLIDTSSRSTLKKNSMGWDIFPEGLYELLVRIKIYRLPVFILENGICTGDDALRWEFIRGHLKCLAQAMGQGVKVLGYIYWSLLDNFEWDKGFAPRFGLIEVDYGNYERKIRESAVKLSQVSANGILEDEVN
ncbi:MAG: glycoside hydrolase family 1 protein [Candidatus Omnitrophota bacterium]|nr:glycoside hydrolase family 1 protein [Candidatus Omnitrophota bacterium]